MERNVYTLAEELQKNLGRVADASAGICPLGPSKKVKAAIRKTAKGIDVHADPDCRRLKRLFESKFGIAGESIVFANSCRELLYMIMTGLKPSRVLMSGPSKPDFTVPEGTQIISGDADEAVSGDLFFVSNPNRITGKSEDRKSLFTILRSKAEEGVLTVLDESLIEFTNDSSYAEGTGTVANLIVLRTTANFFGIPGLELAWAVSAPRTISAIQKVFRPSLNHLALEAAGTALKDRTYIKNARSFIRDERERLFDALKKIEGIELFESDSNVYLLRIGVNREKTLERLARAGFLIRDCSGVNGMDNSYLRLSVMSHDKDKKLVRILKPVKTAPVEK